MRRLLVALTRLARRELLLCFLALPWSYSAWTQQTAAASHSDAVTLQLLMKRIDQLEARVKQLEAERQLAVAVSSQTPIIPVNSGSSQVLAPTETAASSAPSVQSQVVSQTSSPTPSEADSTQSENVMADRMDLSKTLLRIRGFGDIALRGDTQKGDTTSFELGQLDLFISSDVAEKFKFLSEVVFEAGPDNIYGTTVGEENAFSVDVERYLMQYSPADYLKLSVGRVHTAIGYYNTAFHHSTWLQTTTNRPFLFEFEDRGGILPVHLVGVSASGLVPSGRLGLHYVAEVGNGRESRTPLGDEPVQNKISDENHKAFNLALFARPTAVPGLQTGFSVYHDVLAPDNQPKIDETILAAHAVLVRPKWEWLNEAVLDRHAPFGGPVVYHTPGFYSQVSRQFGSYRPYFRYQYLNVAKTEPVFPDVSLQYGPSLGLRYDASEFVALKFQYDYRSLRNQPGVNGLTLQLGFTF
jgi:hypothetical protein